MTIRDERDSLLEEIAEIVLDPDTWLDMPNSRLGGQQPRTLLDSDKGREVLRNLVRMVECGMVT